jgi:phosphatidylserine decarboxylase
MTNFISRIFGSFASKEFSPNIQSFINNSYVSLLGLDMSEFDDPSEYKSLNALFTRELNTPRSFDQDSTAFIAPTDSYISDMGTCDLKVARQIKGMHYFIDDLITEEAYYLDKIVNGHFINFYLSPKDYHRYHAPTDLKIKKLIHVAGKLYPVNFTYLRKKLNLFVENERVIVEATDNSNRVIYLIFVGALNVGKMAFTFEPKVETNTVANNTTTYEYDDLTISKGDEMGYFKMGSTIVILTEPDYLDLQIKVDQSVKFSQTIAKVK